MKFFPKIANAIQNFVSVPVNKKPMREPRLIFKFMHGIIILVFTGILTWVGCQQVKMESLDKRAFIDVSSLNVQRNPTPTDPDQISILIPWKNIGEYPTKNLIVYSRRIFWDKDSTSLVLDYDDLYKSGTATRGSIGPNNKLLGSAINLNLPALIRAYQQGLQLYIYGLATYDDHLNQSHKFQFCVRIIEFKVEKDISIVGISCDNIKAYNCADDECAKP